jgi:Flp pilus assembly pilin Flp
MKRAQNLVEFALLAVPIIAGVALFQSTVLPALSTLFSTITNAVLSLRV